MDFRYGLLSEGESDLYSLRVIIERLGNELGHVLVLADEQSTPVTGSISKHSVRLRTKAFLSENLDFGVYLADNDRGEQNKSQMFRDNISHVNPSWVERSIIGIPDPHMEAWLIADQDTVKNYLGIQSHKPLPYPNLNPKKRLDSLATYYGGTELTISELRKTLAGQMDIRKALRKNSEFRLFAKEFRRVINYIVTQEHDVQP